MPYYLFLTFIFIFGAIIGSFLNCLIFRLHTGEGMGGRSRCPKCKKQIDWYDNIPVLSFVFLRGKCRHCGKLISFQYPAVELMTGILFLYAFSHNFDPAYFQLRDASLTRSAIFNFQFLTSNFLLQTFRDWFFIAIMIIIFIYDLRWYLILDVITLPACLIVFILNIMLGYSWQGMLFSGIIGMSFFLIQFLVSKGKWIGGGDIRLGLLMGLSLGWPGILVAIMLAYFIGSIVGLGLIAFGRKKWGSEIPLGVFLSLGAVITLFWGDKILNWYLGIFRF